MRLLLLISLALSASALDNGLGLTPQMGWNSWNHFHCSINQSIIQETADAFIKYKLNSFGYQYVNVDDCWAGSRDPTTHMIQPDTKTFPDFQGMIDYVHSKGLKFGLYSAAAPLTCQKRPGSLGFEKEDANRYAVWKVDYLKYDHCYHGTEPPQKRYPPMRDALNATGRPIFFSVHMRAVDGNDDPSKWAWPIANSWRTTTDIKDAWETMISRADSNNGDAQYAKPGGWNDPDMLEVGNGHMTTTEYETHFSLWCLMKAPLLIGCDVRNMSDDTLRILTNQEVIAVNQDKLGIQGKKVVNGTSEVWAGKLYAESGSAFAVILLNRGSAAMSISGQWSDIGLDPAQLCDVRDLWAHKDLGSMTGKMTAMVPSHGVAMYKLSCK